MSKNKQFFPRSFIDRKLFSYNIQLTSFRAIKFIKKLTISLKFSSQQFFLFRRLKKYVKCCYTLSIYDINKTVHKNYYLSLQVSQNFHKTVSKLRLSLPKPIHLHNLPFSNLKYLSICLEQKFYRNEQRKICLRMLRTLLCSPKISELTIDPMLWELTYAFSKYSKLRTVNLDSHISELFRIEPNFQKGNLANLNYCLYFVLDVFEEAYSVNQFRTLFANTETLRLKHQVRDRADFLLIPDISHHLTKLKSFCYQKELSLPLVNTQTFHCISQLHSLLKLELELDLSYLSSYRFLFDHLTFPEHLQEFRFILTKCNIDFFNEVDSNQQFFLSLANLKELEIIEFQISKQFSFNNEVSSGLEILTMVLRSIHSQLRSIKITVPGAIRADDNLLVEILKYKSLTSISLDLLLKVSDQMLERMKSIYINLKTLYLYDNFSLIFGLPNESLKQIEDLCIYVSPENLGPQSQVYLKGTQLLTGDGIIKLLRKVRIMQNLRNLSLYFFRKDLVDKGEEFTEEVAYLLQNLKKLESLFLLIWSLTLDERDADILENSFRWSKHLTYVYMMVGLLTIGRDSKRLSYRSHL